MGVPLVSIGLPVYNAAAALPGTLDSLLSQTLADFELLISDNASTDATPDVVDEFRRRDARIRAVRQPRNLGAPANWNVVARAARGRYFKWAAAGDRCAPELLARCVQALDADPLLAVCWPRTAFVDENGEAFVPATPDFAVLDERPSDRFRRVCHHLQLNNAQNGVIRTAMLCRTHYDRPYPHGDRVLMAELALQGKLLLLDETLLIRRGDAAAFSGRRSAQALQRMFRPDGAAFALLNLRRHADFLASALRSPVAWRERLAAAGAALQGLYWDRRGVREDLAALVASD